MDAALYPVRDRVNVPLYFDTDKDVPYERKILLQTTVENSV